MRAYSGTDGEEAMARCPQCKGYGEITNAQGDQEICPFCNGAGMVAITRATQYAPEHKGTREPSTDSSTSESAEDSDDSTADTNHKEQAESSDANKESASADVNEPRTTCPQCNGLGQALVLRKHQRCPLCDGHGSVTRSTATRWGQSRKKSADDYRPSS